MYEIEVPDKAMNYVAEVRMLFFGLYFLYLFIRKQYKVFLSMACVFFAYVLVSYFIPGIAIVLKIAILIGLFILVLVFNFKELNALDKSGKAAYAIMQPDRMDLSVFIIFLIVWVLFKVFLFNN